MRFAFLALVAILCATLLGDANRDAAADGPISGPPGVIESYAGGGTGGEGSPRLEASILPFRLAFSPSGELHFSEWLDGTHTVRKITGDTVVRVAGGGSPATGIGDGGPALVASFQRPSSLAFASDGDLFVADQYNCVVRHIEGQTSVINTVAGIPDGQCAEQFAEGVPPTETGLANPEGVAIDSAGRLYIADSEHCLIRRLEAGILVTIAGVPWFGYPPGSLPADQCVDEGNGPATSRHIEYARDVEVTSNGDVYAISNCTVKRIRNGEIKTLATYTSCGTSDAPVDLAVSPTGAIFVAHYNCYITMLSEGVVTTIAGANGDCTTSGVGGFAKHARLRIIAGLALDSAGNLFLSDITEQEPNPGQFIRVIYGAAADTDGDGYTDAAEANIGEDHTTFCRIMRADVSRDGVVNVADLGRVASQFGSNPEYPRYDQNADGRINPADLGLTASVFGKRPAACPDVSAETPTTVPTMTQTVTETATTAPTATATPMPSGRTGMRPLAVSQDLIDAGGAAGPVTLVYSAAEGAPNVGPISIDALGVTPFADGLKFGATSIACASDAPNCSAASCPGMYPVTCAETSPACDGPECPPNTGNYIGPIRSAIDFMLANTSLECDTFAEAFSGPDSQGAYTLNAACDPAGAGDCAYAESICSRRVMTLPVVNWANYLSGSVTIESFVTFWLEGYASCMGNTCHVSGRFVH